MDKIQILKELVNTFGISGFEEPIREKIKELLSSSRIYRG